MKKPVIVATLALCALFATAGAYPQSRVITPKGIFNPIVGSGAQYEIDNQGGKKTNIEVGIVGKESAEGKDGYWLETSADAGPMGTIVMKMLLVVDGSTSRSVKTVMQMAGRPPMEMPMAMAGRGPMAQQAAPEDVRNNADDLGSESVTVPAGTFTCEHYRGKNGDGTDAWVSKDAPPYGLVKMTNKDKDQTVVLVKLDKNYQDKITGTPVPFNPAAFMGRAQQ